MSSDAKAWELRQVRGRAIASRMNKLPHDTETPDIETSSEGYRRRFAGTVGVFFLDVQAQLLLEQLRKAQLKVERCTVLDLGGGHAQVTRPLLDAGATVVTQGSAESCATYLKELPEWGSERLSFICSNLWAVPRPDRSVDAVIALRVMAHVERWQELLAEMCRLSKQAVVIDFPSKSGMNALTPLLFSMKKKIEGNTRPYFSYSRAELEEEFRKNGFEISAVTKQFALPMGLHRALRSAGISRFCESLLRGLGVTGLVGSPVLLCAVRKSEAA